MSEAALRGGDRKRACDVCLVSAQARRREARRNQQVGAARAAEGACEGGNIFQVRDGDLGTASSPRRSLRCLPYDDTNLLATPKKGLSDDRAQCFPKRPRRRMS